MSSTVPSTYFISQMPAFRLCRELLLYFMLCKIALRAERGDFLGIIKECVVVHSNAQYLKAEKVVYYLESYIFA